MTTIEPEVWLVQTRRALHWSRVKIDFVEWRRRTRLRHELAELSDRGLQDIGMARATAGFETAKPFWMA